MRRELITLIRDSIIISDRARRLPEDTRSGLLRIHPGVHLPRETITSLNSPWDQRNAITLARIIAAVHAKKGSQPFARSAAMLSGWSALDEDPTIHLRIRTGGSTAAINFPELTIGGRFIAPATRTVQHRSRSLAPAKPTFTIPDRDESIQILLQCLLTSPGEEAFAFACQGLQSLLGGRPGRDFGWRRRESAVKEEVLRAIDALPVGTRHKRSARWIIEHASAGCESIGEIKLLWILQAAGVKGIVTQVEVSDAYIRYYIDLGIPGLKIAIEFDGRGKYGVSAQAQLDAIAEQEARQRELEIRGWIFLRFTWADLSKPQTIIDRVEALIRSRGGSMRRSARFPGEAAGIRGLRG